MVKRHGEERLSFCEHIAVQHDLFSFIQISFYPSAQDLILLALLCPSVILEGSKWCRNGRIRLFDARHHLVVKRLLQLLKRLHGLFGPAVLHFQKRDCVGVLPVPQVKVEIGNIIAVDRSHVRTAHYKGLPHSHGPNDKFETCVSSSWMTTRSFPAFSPNC